MEKGDTVLRHIFKKSSPILYGAKLKPRAVLLNALTRGCRDAGHEFNA